MTGYFSERSHPAGRSAKRMESPISGRMISTMLMSVTAGRRFRNPPIACGTRPAAPTLRVIEADDDVGSLPASPGWRVRDRAGTGARKLISGASSAYG